MNPDTLAALAWRGFDATQMRRALSFCGRCCPDLYRLVNGGSDRAPGPVLVLALGGTA